MEGPNPNYQEIELQLKIELANLAALETQEKALTNQRLKLREDIEVLNNHGQQIEAMQRQVDALAVSYRVGLEKMEQARIEEEMRTSQISSVNVLQPATYAFEPSITQRSAFALVLIFAGFGSVALAFTAEGLDSTLKSARHVEDQLGLPVLVCVSRVSSRRSLLSDRHQQPCLEHRTTDIEEAAPAIPQGELTS
jgi:uncharacterized protein involved in exopolysaccharide biosynthesis